MIVDLNQQKFEPDDQPFDVCIAGGGVAGIALATTLADRGRRVVVLEAGGRSASDASQDQYRGENVGLENLPLNESRVRALGGRRITGEVGADRSTRSISKEATWRRGQSGRLRKPISHPTWRRRRISSILTRPRCRP